MRVSVSVHAADVVVLSRNRETLAEHSIDWGLATADLLSSSAPWRVFRWHRGQKHYSGTYWCATERAHVIYESRLELARLLYADFSFEVKKIVAQPFLLQAKVGNRVRRHVPDFLLIEDGGPIVVDVKPSARMDDPKVRFTLDWTRKVIEARGWRYQVWSEPPTAELENVRFLAGFRNPRLFDGALLDAVKGAGLVGAPLGEALSVDLDWPTAVVRSAVLHLIWGRHLSVDIAQPLTALTVLEEGPNK